MDLLDDNMPSRPLPRRERRNEAFSKLATEIEEEGGIKSFTMGRLRDAYEAGRLGVHVVVDIREQLSKAGIGVLLPADSELPREQTERVTLYLEKSDVGQIIDAVRNPRPTYSEQLLRKYASDHANKLLDDVRSLVCKGEGG